MYKQLRIWVTFLSVLISSNLYAQTDQIDSLEKLLLKHNTNDTTKINRIVKLCIENYRIKDMPNTLKWATQAKDLSDKLNYPIGKAESLWMLGRYHGNYDKNIALDYYHKAIKVAEQANYKFGLAKYLNVCSLVYRGLGDNAKALDYNQKALKIASEINDKVGMAKYSQNLGLLYHYVENYPKAIEEYKYSIKISEEIGDKFVIIRSMHNLGCLYKEQGNYSASLVLLHKSMDLAVQRNDKQGIFINTIEISNIMIVLKEYNSARIQVEKALKTADELKDRPFLVKGLEIMGNICLKTKDPQAIYYYLRAKKIAEQIPDKTLIMDQTVRIGDYYLFWNMFVKAEENFRKALTISFEIDRKSMACKIWKNIGTIYFKQKKYDQALDFTLKSLELANSLKLLDMQNDVNKQLSEIYYATGQYNEAYTLQKLSKQYNDSLFGETNIKKLTELQLNHNFDTEKQAIELEKQKKLALQIAEMKVRNAMIITLIIGILLSTALAIYLFRSYQFKIKTNLVLTQQKQEIEALNAVYASLNKELKHSNEELFHTMSLVEESEEKLRLLIKNSNDIIVMINEKGEQFFISNVASTLTGYPVDDLLGSVTNMLLPDDSPHFMQHFEKVLKNKNSIETIQYRHKHKYKGYIWFEAVLQNFLAHPSIKAIVANVRDITERKSIEKALKESEEEKTKLMHKEMERMNAEIESNQKSMTAATLKLIQNSERDTKAIAQLQEIEKDTNKEGRLKINSLISDYKRVSYNSNWDEFEILFERVHRTFYENLHAQFPNLTANERKLCAFLKLNMSSKDIAQITFQSDDALKKARLRLRQKLCIDHEMNLTMFLQNV
jgi:PAS domain S-box-containing protein